MDTHTLDLIASGTAIAIFVGGLIMMFTDILSRDYNYSAAFATFRQLA